MSKDAKITTEQLHGAVQSDLEQLFAEVVSAVNNAPGGAVIAGSEEGVRDAMARFRQRVYEEAVQLRTQAAEAAFPRRCSETGERWRNKGRQGVNYLTANGSIRIDRTVYWRDGEGTDSRLDEWLGIDDNSVSVGARELCSRATVTGPSFRKSAENLERLGQIRVSAERLRGIVENEGRCVLQVRDKGVIGPDWQSSDCQVSSDGPSRVTVGSDGVMVPVVTESEKRKRRENRDSDRRKQAKRSGASGRRTGRRSRKARRKRGSDGPYKEFKLVAFYDQDNERQYVAGTAGNHEALGGLMGREAAKLGFDQADEKVSVTDGAKWIRRQFEARLPVLDAMILDYYHLSEHVAHAANTCFGQGSEQAEQWRREVLGAVWEEGPGAMLARVHETRKSVRAESKREELRKLEQYVAERGEMVDYPTYRTRGFGVGSGPTESFCKTLTARLKGSGMRWDLPNAEGMMALAALEQSNLWNNYWDLRRPKAA